MLRAQHTPHGVLAVGLRQKTLPKCFLLATMASRVFQQPISDHQWLNAIRVYPRHPRENSSISDCPSSDPAGHVAHFEQGEGTDLGLWHQGFDRVHRIQGFQNPQESFEGRARASFKVVQSAQRDTCFVGKFALRRIAAQPERPQPLAQHSLQFIRGFK
jgi:hypothetical protein